MSTFQANQRFFRGLLLAFVGASGIHCNEEFYECGKFPERCSFSLKSASSLLVDQVSTLNLEFPNPKLRFAQKLDGYNLLIEQKATDGSLKKANAAYSESVGTDRLFKVSLPGNTFIAGPACLIFPPEGGISDISFGRKSLQLRNPLAFELSSSIAPVYSATAKYPWPIWAGIANKVIYALYEGQESAKRTRQLAKLNNSNFSGTPTVGTALTNPINTFPDSLPTPYAPVLAYAFPSSSIAGSSLVVASLYGSTNNQRVSSCSIDPAPMTLDLDKCNQPMSDSSGMIADNQLIPQTMKSFFAFEAEAGTTVMAYADDKGLLYTNSFTSMTMKLSHPASTTTLAPADDPADPADAWIVVFVGSGFLVDKSAKDLLVVYQNNKSNKVLTRLFDTKFEPGKPLLPRANAAAFESSLNAEIEAGLTTQPMQPISAMALGDINNDGFSDIAIAQHITNPTSNQLLLILNEQGKRAQRESASISIGGTTMNTISSLAIGNLDDDQYGDILATVPAERAIYRLLQKVPSMALPIDCPQKSN